MPRVSVLLPVRNDEAFVGDAIRSLLGQTLADFELLVVDAASTDRTGDVVRQFIASDRRVKLLRQDRREGLGAALNLAAAAARAPLLARTSARTRSGPMRLQRQADWMAAHPQAAIVGTQAAIVDARGYPIAAAGGPADEEAIRNALVHARAFVAETLMLRRRDVEAVGAWATEPHLEGAEDAELAARLATRYRAGNLPEILCWLSPSTPSEALAARTAAAEARVAEIARALLDGRPEPELAMTVPEPARRPGGRLFVAVAAYRDPELDSTVTDLFRTARYPDDITVGVCLQYEPRVDQAWTAISTRPDQVQVLHAHASESRGLGWARHLTERLWNGESHVLQIDAHMRFVDAWDERLREQLDRCTSARPVLTTYPPGYTPPRTLQSQAPTPRLRALRFTAEGLLLLAATADPGPPPSAPTPHAFYAGGFAYSSSDLLRDVPTDPLMYFNATEPTHMVRLWTHGWDPFAPSEHIAYHLYLTEQRGIPVHWRDRPEWRALATRGQKRARHLLGIEATTDADALHALDRYGLGPARTLADYEAFSGVDFRRQSLSRMAIEGRINPRYSGAKSVIGGPAES